MEGGGVEGAYCKGQVLACRVLARRVHADGPADFHFSQEQLCLLVVPAGGVVAGQEGGGGVQGGDGGALLQASTGTHLVS